MTEFFIVQSFLKGKKGTLIAEPPRQVADREHCVRLVNRLSLRTAGAVGYMKKGDPETDDWNDAVLVARSGEVPAEVDEVLH